MPRRSSRAWRHAGRRSCHDAIRGRRVGGGDCRGFLRDEAIDYPVVLMPYGSMDTHASIVLDKVSLAFDDKVVLRDVSFELLPSHTKIILGGSGSGKSTILKLIL